jgi:hypothetical protein
LKFSHILALHWILRQKIGLSSLLSPQSLSPSIENNKLYEKKIIVFFYFIPHK